MEPTGDATPPPPMTFAGRAVSQEMGLVRLGGSGRPVAISTRSGDATRDSDGAERRQPRVVLEPQPRSPFGRKLETSVSMSLAAVETQVRRPQTQKSTMPPPERVHTTHYPTHRTPLVVALRRANAAAMAVASAPPSGGSRKRSATSETEKTTGHKQLTARVIKTAKNLEGIAVAQPTAIRSAGPPPLTLSPKATRVKDLKPEHFALFTRQPEPADGYQLESHPYHVHERLTHLALHDDSARDGAIDESEDSISGWRAVDNSIDHIYEDPSIDIVQQQLLLHGKVRSGEKRKAVERERLQAAAAEVQKQREGQNLKLIEFQHRREQILKMSNDIRARNRVSRQATSVSANISTSGKKKIEEASVQPIRKPPVPRLSQLGGKAKEAKPKKKADTKDESPGADLADGPTQIANRKSAKAVVGDQSSDGEDHVRTHSDSRASESILLSSSHHKNAKKSVGAPSKKRKQNNISVHQSQQVAARSPPVEEKLQRRAVAREYMQIQKQTRQLMQAKLIQQRQLEEERRRLELQRLEQTRLIDLEEARKRRIRQKQRERVALRKRDEEKRQSRQDRGDHSSRSASPARRSGENYPYPDSTDDKGAENQSFRGNHPVLDRSAKDTFEWPNRDHDSSRASSPRCFQQPADQHKDPPIPAEGGPKLQKLLALEEQTKRLAQKLLLLSRRSATDETSIYVRDVQAKRAGAIDDEMDSVSGSRVDERDDGSDGSEGNEGNEGSEGSDNEENDSNVEGDLNDQHSATRVDQEDFVYFDGGFPRSNGLAVEFDLSSIGVQKIQVGWPRDDESDDGDEEAPSSRFEVLPSSSSSSTSSRQGDEIDTRSKHGKKDRSLGSLSPKLLEGSVDTYAQRLFHLSVQAQTSTCNERPETMNAASKRQLDESRRISSSSRLRSKVSPPRRKQQTMSSDAELLRLIRESDDNLSVIDREAKRRFRLQQDRLRQGQQEQERQEQEKLKTMLNVHGNLPSPRRDVDPRTREAERDVQNAASESSEHPPTREHLKGFEKLDQILEAVRTESDAQDDDHQPTPVFPEEPSEQTNRPNTSVTFWNSQLRPDQADNTSNAHRRSHVEIDRRDINAQRERQLDLEDEEDDFDRPRLLSPQTLAKRLLAAVEYHEVIHDAHLQLSMMEKEHALEQVQQETIALAQAFKEELDGNLLAQQLVDDHATLEDEFDRNLKQVVDQLETVREAEQRESELVRRQLEEEARLAKRRESAVQTEVPHNVDAATSARLRVEVASTTDAERHDAGVQHSLDSVVPLLPTQTIEEEDEYEPVDDYIEETFDRTSLSSPLEPTQVVDKVRGDVVSVEYEDDSVEEESEEVLNGDDMPSVSRGQGRDEYGDEVDSDGDIQIGDGEQREGVQSVTINDDHQSVEDEDELMSAASSPLRQTHSVSVAYDDDDFEDDASFARVESKRESQNVEIASEEEVYESEEEAAYASKPQSESGSVGYADEEFERDASIGQETNTSEPLGDRGRPKERFTDETSEAAVSSDHSDEDEGGVEDAISISDDPSLKNAGISDEIAYFQKVGDSTDSPPTRSAPQLRLAQQTPSAHPDDLPPTAMFSVTIGAPHVARAASVDPELARSYLVQLENRKQSEEALLDIRLRALESKLQQDLQCIIEEIQQNELVPRNLGDERTRSELELRKDAVQMLYLSEKANIESQKSACVSRYYQDLLAFRSFGVATTVAAITGLAATHTAQSLPTSATSTLPGQAAAPVRADLPKKVDGSESDAYEDDEFVTSGARSDAHVDEFKGDTVPQDMKSVDSIELKNASERDVHEEEDDIASEQSVVVEEESEDAISSVPENDGDQDYGDEEFAAVSESSNVEERDEGDKEGSIESSPSIVDEPPSVFNADEASIAYQDEFAEDAVIQDDSSPLVENEADTTIASTGESDAAESTQKIEPDEASQVYDDDEFASVSDSAVSATPVSVSDEDLDGEGKKADENDKPIEKSDSDAVDDAYEDEFASVSETAAAPEEHDSVSEDDIHEDNPQSEHTPEEPEDDTSLRDRSKSDDIYADDGFEESEVPSGLVGDATSPTHSAPNTLAPEDEEEDGGQYSDEDFEQSEGRSRASSGTSDPTANDRSVTGYVVAVSDAETVERVSDVVDRPVDDGFATYELSNIKSLSASELSVANISQAFNHDTSAMPTALAESISVSHQEEDLTTASMEEQLKRIDDLKRQIDLRKEAFAVVQKKMRVEKKKEHLREAEAQLWEEVEQLESQLVADERILELTRQRGRLESMELEVKHFTLQQRGKELPDLLADFDYCEPVEPVKPVVVKQDHQAQVRLADQPPPTRPPRILVTQTSEPWDQDLLLAFDHVERAERPGTTVTTNTETVDQRDDKLSMPGNGTKVLQLDAVPTDDNDGSSRSDTVLLSPMLMPEHSPCISDVGPAVLATSDEAFPQQEPKETIPTDRLAGFDHVEVTEVTEVVLDLLHGYDHVEVVEPCTTLTAMELSAGDNVDTTSTCNTTLAHEETTVQGELTTDDEDSIQEDNASIAESLDEGKDKDSGREMESALQKESDAVNDDIPDSASLTEPQLGQLAPESHDRESYLERRREEEDDNEISIGHDFEEDVEEADQTLVADESSNEPSNSKDEDERVQLTVEDMLASLLCGALVDVRSASLRKANRDNVLAGNGCYQEVNLHISRHDASPMAQQLTTDHDDAFSDGDSDTEAAEEAFARPTTNSVESDAHVLVTDQEEVPSQGKNSLKSSADKSATRTEQHDDAIVESVFASLVAAAIQDGIQLEQKKKRRRVPESSPHRQDIPYSELQPQVVSDERGVVCAVPLHPDRKIENAILLCLRIDSGLVTLPAFHACVIDQRGTSNARAIYDAALEVASSVYQQLCQDPRFRDEQDAQKKHHVLVDRVKREMEDSVWSVQERACEELDRFGRKLLEDEQGELDQDDLRLLLAQQRGGTSSALVARFQAVALRTQRSPAPSSTGAVITPRLRRRGSSSSSLHASYPALASQILQEEEARLADRITERLMRDLVGSETTAALGRR